MSGFFFLHLTFPRHAWLYNKLGGLVLTGPALNLALRTLGMCKETLRPISTGVSCFWGELADKTLQAAWLSACCLGSEEQGLGTTAAY